MKGCCLEHFVWKILLQKLLRQLELPSNRKILTHPNIILTHPQQSQSKSILSPIFQFVYRSGHGLKTRASHLTANSKMFLNGPDTCSYCHLTHSVAHPCATLCSHCKALHMLEDLVDGQCPKMTGFKQGDEYKSMVPCGECSRVAVGLEEGQQVSFGQCKGEVLKNMPIQWHGSECQECLGVGMLPLVTHCCTSGCYQCGFLKFRPHPTVKRLHMRPFITEHDRKQCAICLESIKQGESVFRMQCDHEFHFLCMAQWLIAHKRCPYCRHTDMFLDVGSQFHELLRQMQGYPKPEVLPAYINGFGEVVEGFESDDELYSSEFEQYEEHIEISEGGEGGEWPMHMPVISDHEEEGEEMVMEPQFMLPMGIGFPKRCVFIMGHQQSSQEECCFQQGDDDFDGLFEE